MAIGPIVRFLVGGTRGGAAVRAGAVGAESGANLLTSSTPAQAPGTNRPQGPTPDKITLSDEAVKSLPKGN